MTTTPTVTTAAELQAAFDHFNVDLFDGSLRSPLLTLQRQRKTPGYFTAERFVNRDGEKIHELALNPTFFAVQSLQDSMKTLVLQMAFCWQYQHGTPGRRRYCNKEYGDKLQSIGLMPSNTGRPGGKMVGEKLDAVVLDDGPFEQSCARLLTASFALSWLDRFPVGVRQLAETLHRLPEETRLAITQEEIVALDIQLPNEEKPKSGQVRYYCPLCMKRRVWGKKGLDGELIHAPCNQVMVAGDIEDFIDAEEAEE